jgi:hypothetical protein
MTRRLFILLAGWLAVSAPARGEDLDSIRKEADPLRRYERAIDFADTQLKDARGLVTAGEAGKVPEQLARVADAAELSLQALRDTGRRPGKLAKQYKHGELKTRDFLKRLESLIAALNFSDRPNAESCQMRMTATHEEFLLGVMSK